MSDEERDAERDARRTAREARRAAREAARELRRAGRGLGGIGFGGPHFDLHLGQVLSGGGGDEHSEVVEGRFAVAGMPRVRTRNVSGRTRVVSGPAGEVHVRARKYVRGASADRAKRLLENVEVRMEQRGDEIEIRPHLYEQERGWLELFRGGRVAVDLDITVPRETRLECQTVSGDLALRGTRGPIEVQSVSGDLEIDDVQGPMRLRTVSGDAACTAYVGQVEGNSVSGGLSFARCRLRAADLVSVSGDVEIAGDLDAGEPHRVKTVSGDVRFSLAGRSYDIGYKTLSGGLECELEARITRESRRDRHVLIGEGACRIEVKTVSGDVTVRRASSDAEPAGTSDVGSTEPLEPRAAPGRPDAAVREVLDRVARGELGVDEAAAALDAARGSPRPEPEPEAPPEPGASGAMRGRILRIRVTEGGQQKVNIAIPLAIARVGKAKLGGLVRGHLGKFGLDLDEILDQVERAGKMVDIADDDDRVEIFVE